ncbi:MFS transporter [Nonomuraea sp. ZG12]|uniref:MFS transporter n=1 Tax=Nonomuraea sp. ZG12 TaxID=3452207 RepID=UPI003F8B5B80
MNRFRRLRHAIVDTRPLAFPAYRRTFLGQAAALVGTTVTRVAVPVQVYSISGSSLDVGLVGLATLVPMVVFGLYGGALADLADRRLLYLVSSVLTWAGTLALLTQAALGARSVGTILVLVAGQSAGFAVSAAVRGAIIPALVPVELIPAANALTYTAGNVGQVFGPLVSGALIMLPNGFVYAYGIDALLFTAALYAVFRLPPLPRAAPAGRAGIRAVMDGLRFLGGRPVLLMALMADVIAMLFAMPEGLFPEAAATRFPGGVGLLYASIATGSVLAGLVSGWIGRVRRQGVALTIAVAMWSAAIAVAGLSHTLWLTVPLLVLAGGADLVSAVYRQTILQTYVPDHMRGRMQGVYTVVVAGGPGLGDLRAGVMATTMGLTIAWSGAAILGLVIVLVSAIAVRPFWRYEEAGRQGTI